MPEKIRLDVYMTENKITESRQKASDLIKSGQVLLDGKPCLKPSFLVDKSIADVKIQGEGLKYVSRGGLKLEKAIEEFGIDLCDKIAFDIGASTGGFTDCMLKNGAKKVYAIDVGSNQLSSSLINDERVINMEKTNIRYSNPNDFSELADFISIDVSFISLKLILPVIRTLIDDGGEVVALIKPQFEAGKENIGKKGIVKDIKVHLDVCKNIINFSKDCGFLISGLSFSPIKGSDGNIEYLIHLKTDGYETNFSDDKIREIIKNSHSQL